MNYIDDLKAQQKKVLDALTNRVLSEDEIKRGWKRYDELTVEIAAAVHRQRKIAEQGPQAYKYPPDIKATVDRTWEQLDPTGKRRRTTK